MATITNPQGYVVDKTDKGNLLDYTSYGIYEVTLIPGKYTVMLKGSKGYSDNGRYYGGGRGAIVRGSFMLSKKTTMYVYVGRPYDYWRGNRDYWISEVDPYPNSSFGDWGGHAGGAATDIRLIRHSGTWWSDCKSICSRIAVAAGGGSLYSQGWNGFPYGNAGGYESRGHNNNNKVGQTYGDGFGRPNTYGAGAGGGVGWYSDSGNGWVANYGGAGGSCFLAGYGQCKAVKDLFTDFGEVSHRDDPNLPFTNIKFFDVTWPDCNDATNLNDDYTTGCQITIDFIQTFFIKDSDGKIKYWDTALNAWQVLQMKVKEVISKLKKHFYKTSSEYFNSGGAKYGISSE